MAAIVAIFVLSGKGLDKYFQTQIPWFTLVFLGFSMVAVYFYVVRSIKRFDKKDK
jgi:F0F1-type ATP synthase assembly protein I